MTNNNRDEHSDQEKQDMRDLLACIVVDTWYAVVCCMCHKVIELRHTEEEHLKMETSHSYCDACQIKVLKEIE